MLESLDSQFSILNLVDNEFVPPKSNSYLDDIGPATGATIARVPDSDGRDVDAAVAAAQRAFQAWSRTPAEARSRLLLGLADLIERDADELARIESLDNGKTVKLARAMDIPRAVANFRFFATAILHDSSEAHLTNDAALNYTLHQPIGVAGLISPWNLPLYLLTWKIAPAIASGNCCVAKPSELTPLTAHRLAELVVEAGIPPGVVNIVHGLGPKVGDALTAHPGVPIISFTGGTETGAAVMRNAGPLFKKVSLELGGKNPNVVFADADFDEAVATSMRSSFANQGEICLCGSRIFVERPIFDRFLEAFVAKTRALRVGDPSDDATDVGALVSSAHLAKVSGYLGIAREEGEVLCGGGRPANLPDRLRGGYYLEPAVVRSDRTDCRVMQEEIFGPVVTLTPFDDEAQVVAWANGTRYGLSASLWTRDLERAHRVAAALRAGTVWVNTWLLRDLRVPFGGVGDSGVGREGGRESLRFFTEAKNVCVKMGERR
ncbi:MAG: aldehyde dehydrogenase [Thermoanaerobaculia bacterium]|nr:aldehyde dehydrogenase [Thermoanaerobaculia bacterium]